MERHPLTALYPDWLPDDIDPYALRHRLVCNDMDASHPLLGGWLHGAPEFLMDHHGANHEAFYELLASCVAIYRWTSEKTAFWFSKWTIRENSSALIAERYRNPVSRDVAYHTGVNCMGRMQPARLAMTPDDERAYFSHNVTSGPECRLSLSPVVGAKPPAIYACWGYDAFGNKIP